MTAGLVWNYPHPARADARFTTGEVNTEVVFEQKDASWHISFTVQGPANEVAYSALAIFDGVFQAVADFLAVREPATVLFATQREDLAHLYETWLMREAKRLEWLGYRVDGRHRVLRRVRPGRWT